MERSENRKWILLAAGTFMMLFMGLIYAWSIFRKPLSDIFSEWTPTNLSLTFTISMIMFCVGGFVCGKLAAYLKARWILVISALLLLAGFIGLSLYDPANSRKSLMLLYVCYGVFGGLAIGMSYNAILSSITKWFPGNAGMASGMLLMGFGVGGMALGGIVSVLISAMELSKVFIILGVAMSLVLFAGSFVIAPPAQPLAQTAKGGGPQASARKDYTASEMMKTPSFWLFGCWVIFIGSAGLLVINSAAVISVAFGSTAVLGLIVSIFNGAGRIILGTMFDKIGRAKTMTINSLIMIAAGVFLFAGAAADNAALIFVGLPLVGVAYGGAPSITSATVNAFYGPKNFGVNLGTINFSLIASAMIGPLISSRLQEASGGAYNTTFLMIIIVGIAALIVSYFLTRASRSLEAASNS